MAENYGTLEGTLDEHGMLSGEMDDRATLEGEIQFGSGGGGVLDVFQNGQSVVEGRYAFVIVPTFLKDLRADDYHNTVTRLEMEIWNGKADPSDIPENVTDLSDISVSDIQNGQVLKWDATQEKFVNADESGGGGDVTDVQINDVSVVDANGVAKIDLTPYAEKSDLGTASSKDVPATGNAGANEVVLGNDTRLSDSRPASDVSSWAKADSKPTYQYSEIQNTPSLGTAAAKDFDNSVIDGSSNLVTGDAVHDAIDNAVSGAYKHAGTKTCAELISSLLVKANAGNVYNMTDSGTTTSDFIEGAGLPIRAGDNVGVAKIDENTYKFDLLSGFVDTSNFITKSSTSGLVKNDGSIDTTSYQPTESGKGLSTNDYDNIAKGKVDALGTASTKNVPTSGDAGNNEVVLGNDTRLTDARPASDVSAWAKESTKPSYTKSEVGLGNVDNTSDSTKKTNFTGSIASGDTGFTTGGDVYTALGGKADKVASATNGNLAGLNGSGNLTDSGWNGAKDTTSISGNPISISGLKANQLAINPIITLEPIQAGSGTPSPSNIRAISGYDKVEVLSCGKNIWVDGDVSVSNVAYVKVYLSHPIPAGTYKVSAILSNNVTSDARVSFRRSDDTGIKSVDVIYNASGRSISNDVEIEETAYIVYFYYTSPGISGSRTWSNIMITPSNASQTYEPPIKTTDLSESLGQTVYGLTHEVRTGKAKVTRKKVIFRWGDGQGTQQLGNYTRRRFLTTDAAMDSSRTNAICDIAPYVTDYTADNNHFYFSTDRSTYIFLPNNTDDNTQIEVCYVLETPTEIQLTPHEISLLSNYAYVSTNGTNITLDYHNGELASLGDVSQLGETVNELGDYVGRNEYETTVDLTGYVSSSNIYEFPYDGFVHVSSEAATSGRIRATITAHGTVQNIAYIWMDITQAYQRQSLFVKKGMGLYLQDAVPSGTRVRYVPFM